MGFGLARFLEILRRRPYISSHLRGITALQSEQDYIIMKNNDKTKAATARNLSSASASDPATLLACFLMPSQRRAAIRSTRNPANDGERLAPERK